jgi:hypothetical protein
MQPYANTLHKEYEPFPQKVSAYAKTFPAMQKAAPRQFPTQNPAQKSGRPQPAAYPPFPGHSPPPNSAAAM